MNYSTNSFTGASELSEAPAYGGYVLVICKKKEFSCAFSFFLGFKMNIFLKMKHYSYFTFWELSNALYRFQKFELYQELWTKNSEIVTSKNGFSLVLGFKMNIFQKIKQQSYSTA